MSRRPGSALTPRRQARSPDVVCLAARLSGRFPFLHLLYGANTRTERLQGGFLSTLRCVGDALQRVALAFSDCARNRDARIERRFLGLERGAQRRLGTGSPSAKDLAADVAGAVNHFR